ncbi:hypothetical protein DVV91_03735 [Clostridium botulinum]|uniref:HpcH/HpaI aldolase family protein n=1 Tax=Clostridium botulinum TaxID=1491 RepID=UPI00140070C2|nr:aldolase/citrate lyase family protein [Clostridium botulinum]MBN1073455.1 hypothetical protein [Clostridium botulinum]NFN14993.1 hypothetical protein [Clostridium botulinum]
MNLKDKLQKNQEIFGTWCVIPSPEVVNILAKAGLDFVIIDMEHGPMDYTLAQQMIVAAEADSCEAIIRVGENSEIAVLKALDIGASGVIIPHIDSVEECKKAMSYTKYPPKGIRGFSPYTRSGDYGDKRKCINDINKNIITGIIIEGENGIKDIDKIIKEDELDIVYVGTYDISSSLGVPGDTKNPNVARVLEECVKKINLSGKVSGCLYHDKDELEYFRSIGIRFMVHKVDSAVLFDAFKEIRK